MKPIGMLAAALFIAVSLIVAFYGHPEFVLLLIFLGGASLFAFK